MTKSYDITREAAAARTALRGYKAGKADRKSLILPNFVDVENFGTLPSGETSSLILPDSASRHPLGRLNAESFGHQDEEHIGGVPGRIGGCTAAVRYAMEGENSHQLLSWRGLVIVHDNRDELEFLIFGKLHSVELPRNFEVENTIWVKDHPSFQSVAWPLERDDFDESRL